METQDPNALLALYTSVPFLAGSLIATVLSIVGMWKLFEKAGEPGWAAIIPFYNAYILVKIALGNGWLFLLALIPVVNFFFVIWLMIKLAAAFGKGVGFAIGLIFLGPIFMILLGFSDAKYQGVQA
ncbi:DUF5684 domain-containing protein [Schaalia sp. Marseille-Q2122]|uniref:DUF5684 domain-containing protein n=1 Tax=Schaalia sp. Marseille-Q2122 TaxID=2736604 RepID=UPI00158ACA0A|nr:DUF5684 domain-containing protein [Schaalia sp. Marseille-Q2122]